MLPQRLAEAGDVAVPEDAQAAGEEARARAVALDLLRGQEADEGLGDGDPGHIAGSIEDSSSESVGMSSAHASFDATYAPAALASRSVRSRP